eukprot:1345216-Pyramimonas_sp.AAC.1
MTAAEDEGLGGGVGSSPLPSCLVGRDGGISESEPCPDDDQDGDTYDDDDDEGEDEDAILAELEDLGLDETQVDESLA